MAPSCADTRAKAMSARPNIRLLLADVDGTLLTEDKVLTDCAKHAVVELGYAGIVFAIVSSRPPRGMEMLIKPLGLRCIVAGLNGGMYVNPDMSIVRSYKLDPAVARIAVDLILKAGLDVWLYTEQEWLIRNRSAPHVEREVSILKFEPRVSSSFSDVELADAVKLVGVSDDPKKLAACQTALSRVLAGKASVTQSQLYYIDITDFRANKGAVVTALSRSLQIPIEQIATIGDMPTDALMFHKSGFSIAMGNASADVKLQASVVTDNNENNGFAKAVRRYVLPQTVVDNTL